MGRGSVSDPTYAFIILQRQGLVVTSWDTSITDDWGKGRTLSGPSSKHLTLSKISAGGYEMADLMQ